MVGNTVDARVDTQDNPTGTSASGAAPLGPESLTWRRFGDLRVSLLIAWAGLLQGMHPVISAALIDHSDVFDNPTNRLLRSAPPILDVVYADDSAAGSTVRDYHRNIQGTDPSGRRYHALNPEPYFWAHATFVAMQYVVAERFGEPLTEREKEQLYRESITWYRRYGLSMRPVPPDYAAFRRYWEHTVTEVLAHTEAIRRSGLAQGQAGPPPYPWIPPLLWRVAGPRLVGFQLWIARGLLPEPARRKLGWRWSKRDERLLAVLAGAIRLVFRVLPPAYRLAPVARRAFRSVRDR